MKTYQIICIDDDEQFLGSLAGSLPDRVAPLCTDFHCLFDFVASGEELFELLSARVEAVQTAMIISDQMMPGTSGIELIEQVKAAHPNIVSMLLTGHGGLDSATYAINRCLLDQYVCKPIEDMQEFAAMVANLLKRHHLDAEERERTAQLAQTVAQLRCSNEKIGAMQEAAEQVAMLSKNLKSLDFDEVVELISQKVPDLFGAEWGVLCFIRDGCPMELIRRSSCPCPDAELRVREDAMAAIRDGQIRCDRVPSVCDQLGARSPDIIVPLDVTTAGDQEHGHLWRGYLCMCSLGEVQACTADLLRYKAGLISEILSANLTNAKLYEQAKKDSQTDPLTGVNSRRVLEEKLEAEYERSMRYKHTFCVAIMDIDRFKSINDRSGHSVGDKALRDLTEILRKQMRNTDTLARYGGDEFVLLMPETQLADATGAVERMRKRVEQMMTDQSGNVTISCGLAGWSGEEDETGTDVLRRADSALYEAKRTGRNRLAVAEVV